MSGQGFLVLQERGPRFEPLRSGYDLMLHLLLLLPYVVPVCISHGIPNDLTPSRSARARKGLLEVASQMVEAFGRDGGASLRLGENETTLDDSLDVQREGLGRPIAPQLIFPPRLPNSRLQRPRMRGQDPPAGRVDIRVRDVRLLNDSAEETGEFGQFARHDRLAKLDIGDEPIERIGPVAVGRIGKKRGRPRAPV